MEKNKNILVGVAKDGKGGIDSYILSFVSVANSNGYKCDVLTTNLTEKYKAKLSKMNANLIETPNLHNKDKIFSHLSKLNKEKNYQAAYWNISTSVMYPYVKASKKCGINKNIVHSHAANNDKNHSIVNCSFDILHKILRSNIKKYTDIYAACSKNAAKWMFGNAIAENNKYIFVPNPIEAEKCQYNDQARTKIRKQLHMEDKFVVGCVSSFRPHKNMPHLIEVFKNLQDKLPNATLLVCADGPFKNEFEKQTINKLREGSYKLLGHVDNVQEMLQAFDVFVFPSEIEGFGMALVEAQAADLDCIFGKGIPEEAVVVDDNCHKLDNYNPANWSLEILNTYKKAKKRNRNTYKIVQQAGFNYSSPKLIVDLLD